MIWRPYVEGEAVIGTRFACSLSLAQLGQQRRIQALHVAQHSAEIIIAVRAAIYMLTDLCDPLSF